MTSFRSLEVFIVIILFILFYFILFLNHYRSYFQFNLNFLDQTCITLYSEPRVFIKIRIKFSLSWSLRLGLISLPLQQFYNHHIPLFDRSFISSLLFPLFSIIFCSALNLQRYMIFRSTSYSYWL